MKHFLKIFGISIGLICGLHAVSVLAQSNRKPANVSAEDWQASGQNGIVALRLDGKILNLYHVQGRRLLRQGYDAKRDDKRNVEASPSNHSPFLPSRGLGYEWVLEDVGGGYYHIINLTTGLYLTVDEDYEERNVSNWGRKPSLNDHQKWRFVLSDSQTSMGRDMAIDGTFGTFEIINKRTNLALTMTNFGTATDENVAVWPKPSAGAAGYDWVLMPAREIAAESKLRSNNYAKGGVLKSFYSDSLISVRRVTIEKIKAITVSTGQDDATKALFTGIDVLVEAGIGIATGGASAAASTAKIAGRAVTKEALKSAAKAGAKKAARKVTRTSLAKDFATGLMEDKAVNYGKEKISEQQADDIGTQMASVGLDILDAMGSEAIFNEVYGESPDDFYIRVNGSSIFPHGGREHMDIESQDTLTVNKSFVFDRFDGAAIQLMEYDYASDDDGMGETLWKPYWNSEKGVWVEFEQVSGLLNGKGYLTAQEREALPNIKAAGKTVVDGVERFDSVMISHEDEGSLYEITYRIEPFVPGHLALGKLHSDKLKKRIDAWKPRAALSQDKRVKMAGMLYGNCSGRGKTSSITNDGSSAERIKMYNRGSKPISIYWLNAKGQEGNHASKDKPIHTIAPGKSVEEWGGAKYAYIAVDNTGECVGIGKPMWPYISFEFNFNPDLVVPGTHPRKIDHAAIAAAAKAKAEAEARAEAYRKRKAEVDASNANLERQSAANAGRLYGNCSRRGTVQSVEQTSGTAVGVRMFNLGASNINIYWIDTYGQEVNYASQDAPIRSIASGPTGDTEFGSPGYWYIATDDAGECVGMGTPADFANEFNFNPDLVVPGANPRKATPGYGGDEYADDGGGYYEEPADQTYADTGNGGGAQAEGPGCEYLGQVGSQDGGEIVTVTFSNTGTEEMHLYWINGEGTPTNYAGTGEPELVVPANSYQGVRTMIGHAFAAADPAGNCLAAMLVEYEGENFTIASLQ